MEETARERVFELIDQRRDEILRFLGEYVAHPSPGPKQGEPEVRACQEWLRDQVTSWGCFDLVDFWEGAPDQPNLVAVRSGSGGVDAVARALMLNGHSDVVPVTPQQQAIWEGAGPWSGELRAGRVWGRGACDMKGGNTACLWAARLLAEAGVRLHGDLLVSMVIGEEACNPWAGCWSMVERGYQPPLVVVAEPTGLQVCPAGVGWFIFRLTVPGKALHAASRHLASYPRGRGGEPPGVDAIAKLRLVMDALDRLGQDWALYEHHPLAPPGNMHLGAVCVRAGEYHATLAERAEAVYTVVFLPGRTSAEVLAEIRATVERVAQGDRWLREHPPVLEAPFLDPLFFEPVDMPLNGPAVAAFTRAYRAALGRAAPLACLPGPCDANLLTMRGVPSIIFGPGDWSCNLHGANEFVPADEVIAATRVFASLAIEWCGVA